MTLCGIVRFSECEPDFLPKSPELCAAPKSRQFMRPGWRSNRIVGLRGRNFLHLSLRLEQDHRFDPLKKENYVDPHPAIRLSSVIRKTCRKGLLAKPAQLSDFLFSVENRKLIMLK